MSHFSKEWRASDGSASLEGLKKENLERGQEEGRKEILKHNSCDVMDGEKGGQVRKDGDTNMVHRAVMLVLSEVSMSTELNMRSSRRVCVVGTSTCKYIHTQRRMWSHSAIQTQVYMLYIYPQDQCFIHLS